MNPIGERVLWFVLGLLAGAMLGWLLARPRRARAPASIPVEPATPQPHPAAADAEAATEAGAVIASARLIDVGAARAAGMTVFAFTGGAHAGNPALKARLASIKPDFIFADMLQLPDLIAGLGARAESS